MAFLEILPLASATLLRTRPHCVLIVAIACALTFVSFSADAQVTSRVSVNTVGVEGNDDSATASFSDDGRYVAFVSDADNLVLGDTNGVADIFVRDLQSGALERVSVNSAGDEADDASFAPVLSLDGGVVAFVSDATNLSAADTNGSSDVYLHNRITGVTSLVSVNTGGVAATGVSSGPTISDDGRFVAFWSAAADVVAADTNDAADIFRHDTQLGFTIRVSVGAGGAEGNDDCFAGFISGDGLRVCFDSLADNLVPGDTNGQPDVFVRDLQVGVTTCISIDSTGAFGNDISVVGGTSTTGRYVVFTSAADNLVTGDTNGVDDVFIRDLDLDVTNRISIDGNGVEGNDFSEHPVVSANGQFVAFGSFADNLVGSDTNGAPDIFLHDRDTGITTRVSEATGGIEADGLSRFPAVSADARFIGFQSFATNLVPADLNGVRDVFVRDRVAPPQAGFTATPTTGGSPLFVEFTNTTFGAATSWLWSFGDGEASMEENPTHTYAEEGVYTVSLLAIGPTGFDTALAVNLIDAGPVVNTFGFEDQSVAFGQVVTLPLRGGSDVFISALSAAFSYPQDHIDVTDISIDGTLPGALGAQLDFVQIDDAVGSATLLVQLDPGNFVPPGSDQDFAQVEIEVNGTFTDGETGDLAFTDGLGADPIDNLLFDGAGNGFPPATDDGTLTFFNQTSFIRGDCDADSNVQLPDALLVLSVVFTGGVPPSCLSACDFDDDGALGLTDGVGILAYVFSNGAPPPLPFPDPGVDPTPDSLPCL